jgi:hypothetical protein
MGRALCVFTIPFVTVDRHFSSLSLSLVNICFTYGALLEARGSVVVKALYYGPEGRVFDTQ